MWRKVYSAINGSFFLILFEISRFVYVHFPCMHLKALVLIWNPHQHVPAWDRFDFCPSSLVKVFSNFLHNLSVSQILCSCQAQFRSTTIFDCKLYWLQMSYTYCFESLQTNAHFCLRKCSQPIEKFLPHKPPRSFEKSGAWTFVLRGFWKCIGFDDSSSTGHWSQRQTISSMNFLSWGIKML